MLSLVLEQPFNALLIHPDFLRVFKMDKRIILLGLLFIIMTIEAKDRAVLSRALEVLPSSEEEVVLTGVVTKINERMVELKLAEKRLLEKYGRLEELEERIKKEGVPLEDHRSYNDLLEWRAIKHELKELALLLETI